jgi:Fic family protein
MPEQFRIVSSEYLPAYLGIIRDDLTTLIEKMVIKDKFTLEDFEYYIISSSLYSSKIEGNTLDANSFFRSRGKKSSPKRKEVEEIENLMEAYKFASENLLTSNNFLKCHSLLATTLLPVKERGVLRKEQIGVRDSVTLKPVYLAVEPEFVNREFTKLFDDIAELANRELSHAAVLYFASMIHLWLAKIHPFGDGNGRAARLLEKWFLATKFGMSAWSVKSEQYYWDNRPAYYENISLGFNYYALHWERCVPFLLMLPEALRR